MKADLLEESILKFPTIMWSDPSGVLEAPLIQRLALALDYGFGISNPREFLEFGFHNVFDIISPITAAFWRYDSMQGWKKLSSVGGEMPDIAGAPSWDHVNQAAVLSRRPSFTELTSGESPTMTACHWTVPVIVPARSCYVLQIIAEPVACQCSIERAELLGTFLQSFAHMLANDDLMTHPHDLNCRISDQKASDSHLTDRQEGIMQLLSKGLTYEQIAARMGFSQSTIKQDAMKIFKKLNVANRVEAVQKMSAEIVS